MSDSIEEAVKNHNTIEELATQYGWQSDGEKSAEEFVKVALDKFPDQSKKIKQLFKTVEELKDHMGKTEARAYERAKAELQSQRVQAIKAGDVDLVEQIDKASEDLKPQVQQPQALHPAIAAFEERNQDWLNGTTFEELEMQKWVEKHGQLLGRRKLPVDEHMEILEEHVKKQFPEYFNDNKGTKSPVSASRSNVAGVSKSKSKGKLTFNDLNADQKEIARNFEQLGIMSVDKYISDLVKAGEL